MMLRNKYDDKCPFVHELSKEAFDHLVDKCDSASEPAQGLKDLLASPWARKNWDLI